MQFQNILLTFPWNQRVVVHRRSFFKVVPKFYDQYRLKDIRKFPKLNPRLSETVDLRIPKLNLSVPKKNYGNPNFIVLYIYDSWQKQMWKCPSHNLVTCTILQLSTISGIHEENLKDPLTLQKQVVNRITTSVKPMSLWSPVDNSSMNPSAVQATARWQTAHGKLKIGALKLIINL